MVRYSNKCYFKKKKNRKTLYKCGFQVEHCCFSAHDLSVFFYSSASVLADAATGAAETVTGMPTVPPSPPSPAPHYLLFIWKCSLLPVSADWRSAAVRSSVHIYMNGSLRCHLPFSSSGTAMHLRRRSTVFIFKSQINSSPHVAADFAF